MTDENPQTEPFSAYQSLITSLQSILGADCLDLTCVKNELTLFVLRTRLYDVCQILRDNPALLFKQLMDICGADYPDRPERFDVVYQFLSLHHNFRLSVRVQTDETSPVPSIVPLYSSAGWFERETFDMFGVDFFGNPDLRRILTDYGFDGHPLRKDFPLSGHVEVHYDAAQKRVVYAPVHLTQDYRAFDTQSPWEAMPVTGEESK